MAAREQAIMSKTEKPIVLCYPCLKQGVREPAVAVAGQRPVRWQVVPAFG
jgi:hypothetical protein